MTVLQTIRPTLFALPLTTRRKGQGPKAKPADKIQDHGSFQPSLRDETLADFLNGMPSILEIRNFQMLRRNRMPSILKIRIFQMVRRNGMPSVLEIKNFQMLQMSRSRRTTPRLDEKEER